MTSYDFKGCKVSFITLNEFREEQGKYAYGNALLRSMDHIQYCKADSFSTCTIGTFAIPDKEHLTGRKMTFGFYLKEGELILIGEEGAVELYLQRLKEEHYDEISTAAGCLLLLMDDIIREDVLFLQNYEEKLADIEEELMEHLPKDFYQTVILCRKELLALHTYYEQLVSLGEELETNDNRLLLSEECTGFGIFTNRASRLHDHVEMLREYVLQIREMYQSQIDLNQNRIMGWLTVVTTIFLPLSILVGWYGMNFTNMPELRWKYGYLVMIIISIVIVAVEIVFFRKKKVL
jgi:magnesium transporter